MEQPATIDPLASPEKERRFGRAIRSGARLAAANWLGDATVLNVGMFLSRPDLFEYSCADPIKKMCAICDSFGKLMRQPGTGRPSERRAEIGEVDHRKQQSGDPEDVHVLGAA